MLIVREVFTAKPGQASKLAKFFKEMSTDMPGPKPTRVLTDFIGQYNQVVMEFEFKNVGEWEASMKSYGEMPEDVRKKMAVYTEMWMTGRREIFQTV